MAAVRVLAERYELVRLLGRGGMGEVWEARDRMAERSVAVKLLPSESGDAGGVELLFREARTAGALRHPGVVAIYEVGQDPADGTVFLVMELLHGRSLAAVLREDGVPEVGVAVAWTAQVAGALGAAHRAGVVHRDIKPGNLLVTEEGRVVVLDFGIARFVESTHKSSHVMGTLAYMPPERFQELPGDAKSDLYSLGCVLHELLTGRLPFEAHGPVAMMTAHLSRVPVPPSSLRAGVPAQLDELVRALLAKIPQGRPGSAGEVELWLRAIAAGPAPAPAVPVVSPPRNAGRRARAEAVVPAVPVPVVPVSVAPVPVAPVSVAPVPEAPARPVEAAVPSGRTEPPAARRRFGRRGFLRATAGGVLAAGGTAVGIALTQDGGPARKPNAGPAHGFRPWCFKAGGRLVSAPVVDGGVVYVGNDAGQLYAVDGVTGSQKWVCATHGQAQPPVVLDRTVFVSDYSDHLLAVRTDSGALRWTSGNSRLTGAPAAMSGHVFVAGALSDVYAVDAASGTDSWSFSTIAPVEGTPVVVDGVVYVSCGDHALYALNAGDGSKKWSCATRGTPSTPAVVDGVVYVGTDGGTLHALSAADGSKKWECSLGASLGPVAADGNQVYVGSSDRNLHAVDAVAGSRTWQQSAGGAIGTPTVANGLVYLNTDDGLYAFAVNDGLNRWVVPLGSAAGPAVATGTAVYLGTTDGTLYALDAISGAYLREDGARPDAGHTVATGPT